MEKQLKCVLMLSLKEMALRRVAVTLSSGIYFSSPYSKVGVTVICVERWREDVEDKIKDKILELELPELLTKQMIDIVKPISLQIKSWVELSFLWDIYKGFALPQLVKLCWTTSGTINFRQTAEELLRCDELDVGQRYEIACHFCLEYSISLYWEELSEEEKGNYSKHKDNSPYLPYCWYCILKGEHSDLDYLARKSGKNLTSFYQFAFEYSAEKGYKTAAEYFFQKLTPEEREASLMRTAHAMITNGFRREKRPDLLCHLLSVMSPEQQMEIIKSYPIYVLSCFLHWPLQDLFLDNAGLLWTCLPPSSYAALLEDIFYHCKGEDFYFPNMFKEFFMESPQDFKKYFVGEYKYGSNLAHKFLSAFFKSDDSESIKVMFRNLDAADRVKLVFQRTVLDMFGISIIWGDRWHMIEVCLREATMSREEKKSLKDAFTGLIGREEWKNQKFKRLFEFLLDEPMREKGQKRKLENGSPEQ